MRRKLAGVAAVAALMVGSLAASAGASTTSTANPWTFQQTDGTSDGLVLQGDSSPTDSSILMVKDHAGQPIFDVLKAGGAAVLGDDFRILPGTDVYHAQVTISANSPNPSVCVRNGQLWIGGPAGGIWRCANLGGGYSWWPAVS